MEDDGKNLQAADPAAPRPMRIFVIGASVRAAVLALHGTLDAPVAADLFADCDTAAMAPFTKLGPNYEGAEDALRAAQPDAWFYTGGLENRPALIDRLAAIAPLWGNSGEVLRRVRDPRFLPSALAADGLRHLPIGMGTAGIPSDGSWLRKPVHSAGGGSIAPYRGCDHELSAARPWYYQQFLPGVPQSAVFVVAQGEARLIGVTRQLIGESWTGARDFWYCGSIGPQRTSFEAWTTWREIGQCLTRRGGLTGVFGVDAMVRGDEIWPIEINPRLPASAEILDAARPRETMRHFLSASREGRFARDLLISWVGLMPCWGKAIVFAEQPGVMPAGRPVLFEEATHPEDQLPILADLPAPGTPLRAGEPVLTVFAAGNKEIQVRRLLRRRCAEVKRWLSEVK